MRKQAKNAQKLTISSTKSRVLVYNHHPSQRAPISHKGIQTVSEKIFRKEKFKVNSVVVNLINDRSIKRINTDYLGHHYNTDIITFPYSFDETIEGELFISLDTVKDNSVKYGASFKQELKRVVIHGCLHLCGYDDKTKKQMELIRQKENYYLSIL